MIFHKVIVYQNIEIYREKRFFERLRKFVIRKTFTNVTHYV